MLQWNDVRYKIYESWGLVLWVNRQYVSGEKNDTFYSAKKFAQICWCHIMLTAVAKCATQKCGMPHLSVIVIPELYWYYLSKISLALLLPKSRWKSGADLYVNIHTPASILEGRALGVSLIGVKPISSAELRPLLIPGELSLTETSSPSGKAAPQCWPRAPCTGMHSPVLACLNTSCVQVWRTSLKGGLHFPNNPTYSAGLLCLHHLLLFHSVHYQHITNFDFAFTSEHW